jgi:hypothetical protein
MQKKIVQKDLNLIIPAPFIYRLIRCGILFLIFFIAIFEKG